MHLPVLLHVGSLGSGLLWLILLIQWLSVMLILASKESAVFLNQVLLSSIELGWVGVSSSGAKQNYSSDAVGKLSLYRDIELNRDFC